jgi:hypothetical protein
MIKASHFFLPELNYRQEYGRHSFHHNSPNDGKIMADADCVQLVCPLEVRFIWVVTRGILKPSASSKFAIFNLQILYFANSSKDLPVKKRVFFREFAIFNLANYYFSLTKLHRKTLHYFFLFCTIPPGFMDARDAHTSPLRVRIFALWW